LGRPDAKKQIASALKYPIGREYEIPKSFIEDMNTGGNGVTAVIEDNDWEYKRQMIEVFHKENLLSLMKTPHREESGAGSFLGTNVRTWTTVTVTLNGEGNKYMLREDANTIIVKLWDTDIDNVTGIEELEQEKTAKVDYIISNKNVTPFGINFTDKYETLQKMTYFSLYDDGWRITQR
jgi:hypothetical protein